MASGQAPPGDHAPGDHAPGDHAHETGFFDNFNPNKEKTAVFEDVYHKLCEMLTELAESSQEADNDSAMQAYNDALDAIMKEHSVTQKDICLLADDHPLKEAFFSAYDTQMFDGLLKKFIAQVQQRKDGNEWDAEAAVGECDEDHTLE